MTHGPRPVRSKRELHSQLCYLLMQAWSNDRHQYPFTLALYMAVNELGENLYRLAEFLKDEVLTESSPRRAEWLRGTPAITYAPKPSVLAELHSPDLADRSRAQREQLERRLGVDRGQDAPQWLVAADRYWDWIVKVQGLVRTAREALDAAVHELDVGVVNPAHRPSRAVRATLLRAEDASGKLTYGWDPHAYHAAAHTEMVGANDALQACCAELRIDAGTLKAGTSERPKSADPLVRLAPLIPPLLSEADFGALRDGLAALATMPEDEQEKPINIGLTRVECVGLRERWLAKMHETLDFNARHRRALAGASMTTYETAHPALRLFHALNALHTVCSNAHLFQKLAQQRERARDSHLNDLNVMAKIASDHANARASAGAPLGEAFAEFAELHKAFRDQPPFNEPPEVVRVLTKNVLDHGQTWCERAQEALRAGGAKGLDAATHPTAAGQPRSIEIRTKLRDAERMFASLRIGVGDSRIDIDKHAASMVDLREWFGRTRDELDAVLETRGLDAPPAAPTLSVSPGLLDRLQRAAAAVEPDAIDRAAERAAEKVVANALVSKGNAKTKALFARTEIVLWEGAAHTDRNIRLARTRTAYLEAHGNVPAALAALKAGGNEIARRTFYNHLDALDIAIPHWRDSVQLCNKPAQMHGTRIPGVRGELRGDAG